MCRQEPPAIQPANLDLWFTIDGVAYNLAAQFYEPVVSERHKAVAQGLLNLALTRLNRDHDS